MARVGSQRHRGGGGGLKYVYSLSYSACNAHAPYYIVICGLPGSTIFSHIISEMPRLSEKNVTEDKMCFVFLYYICPKNFSF